MSVPINLSGKTALVLALCRALRDRLQLGVVTNDIFTKEDAAAAADCCLTRKSNVSCDDCAGVDVFVSSIASVALEGR